MNEWLKQLIRQQHQDNHGLDEGLKEEIAQSFGVTVRQIEQFLSEEGLT